MGKTHTHQISADHRIKEDGSNKELLVLLDNLDDQLQKKYQDMCQEGDNTLFCHFHTEYTYDLYPPDAGAGNQIRFWFGFYLDEYLWDYYNVELWYLGLFLDSH